MQLKIQLNYRSNDRLSLHIELKVGHCLHIIRTYLRCFCQIQLAYGGVKVKAKVAQKYINLLIFPLQRNNTSAIIKTIGQLFFVFVKLPSFCGRHAERWRGVMKPKKVAMRGGLKSVPKQSGELWWDS